MSFQDRDPKDHRTENRDDNRKERDDNRKEKEKADKADKPARLGKEAKIGVAVILALIVTFVVVVVVRLRGSDGGEKPADAAAKQDPGKPKAPEDPLFAEASSKSLSVPPATVLSPKPTPIDPPGFKKHTSNWKTTDQDRNSGAGSRYGAISEPTFASDSSKSAGSRYGNTAKDDGMGRFGKNELRPDLPSEKKSGRSDNGGFGLSRDEFARTDSAGRRSRDAAPAPLPGSRGDSRYGDNSADLLAPVPSRDTSSYAGSTRRATPAAPVSQDEDDSFPAAKSSSYDRYGKTASSFGNRSGSGESGKYVVMPGDTYSAISQAKYGTSAYYLALAEHNRGKFADVNRLQPGESIATPAITELQRLYPELCPKAGRLETQQNRMLTASTSKTYNRGRTYTVAEGDTLFNIARYELGKASRWAEIYELNREALGKDFNYLTPGMKLTLPDGEKSDVLTKRQGGDTWR